MHELYHWTSNNPSAKQPSLLRYRQQSVDPVGLKRAHLNPVRLPREDSLVLFPASLRGCEVVLFQPVSRIP
jgi:hypothetical protein